jgi:hypothetical protein
MCGIVDTAKVLSCQQNHVFRPLVIGHHKSKQHGQLKKVETCRSIHQLRA